MYMYNYPLVCWTFWENMIALSIVSENWILPGGRQGSTYLTHFSVMAADDLGLADTRNQGKNTHGTDLVPTEYSCLSSSLWIWRPSLPGMGIPMLKIRRSQDRLIFNMGMPIQIRQHLYIEKAPRRFLFSFFHSIVACWIDWLLKMI